MKINYSVFKKALIILCFIFSGKGIFSQTVNVPYQFYLDANNNCTYDGGENLLYNLRGNVTFTYVNLSTAIVTVTDTVAGCAPFVAINNPQTPPVNGFSVVPTLTNTYGTFSVNSSCSAYSNLSYTTTTLLPIKNINQMSNVGYSSLATGFLLGDNTGNFFPVCYNIGPDKVIINFDIYNLYTCNSTMASRTFSLYLDGSLYDVITNTGLGSVFSSGTQATISEYYTPQIDYIYIQTRLGSGISALGNHSFVVKSTQIFNMGLSTINYSCTLNSVPCTNINGTFYTDCNLDCNRNVGDGFLVSGTAYAQVYGISTPSMSFGPSNTGDFSLFLPSTTNSCYITPYTTIPAVTSCPNVTITVPPGITTNSINLGYQVPMSISDPNVFCHPTPFAANKPNPGAILSFYTKVSDNMYLTSCTGTLGVNPGKMKIKLPVGFTYFNVGASTPTPNNLISGPLGDTIVWNISDFTGFSAVFDVSVSIASTLTVGNSFSVTSFIYPSTDINLINNSNVFTGVVGGPLDPNYKECYTQGIQTNGDIPLGTQDLYYTVNFQNIGTAPAINVTTLDTLDANLDWTTLEVISSSFPVQSQVDNVSGTTFFYFKGINLPDSTSNEPGSHGYVQYKIKLKPSVPVNTTIKNRAHNYFDFNAPVPTNQTKNKLVILAGINELENEKAVFIAPNPVSDKVTISSREIIQTVSVINNLGQIVLKQDVNATQSQMDLSQMTDGIYFIQVQLKDGVKTTRKVVKN